MKLYHFFLPIAFSLLHAPFIAAQDNANCEALTTQRVVDEATGGSALIPNYFPADAFLDSVYDDKDGYAYEVEGRRIRAVFCKRPDVIPSLRDYPILETGIPLSLSQNFDLAQSDVVLLRFSDGSFRADYSGPGLSAAAQAELDNMVAVFNLQPNDLAVREKAARARTQARDEAQDVAKAAADFVGPKPAQSTPLDAVARDGSVDLKKFAAAARRSALSSISTPLENSPFDIAAGIAPRSAKLVPTAACQAITRDGAGFLQKIPIAQKGLEETLAAEPRFVFPVPEGIMFRAFECARDSLTPGAHDYKVAREGYPFFYKVADPFELNNRAAALEFIDGKFRMNLLEGEFTSAELIDAKARIDGFNKQYAQDITQTTGVNK